MPKATESGRAARDVRIGDWFDRRGLEFQVVEILPQTDDELVYLRTRTPMPGGFELFRCQAFGAAEKVAVR